MKDLYRYVRSVEWRPGPHFFGATDQPSLDEPQESTYRSLRSEGFADRLRSDASGSEIFAMLLALVVMGFAAVGLTWITALMRDTYVAGFGGLVVAVVVHSSAWFGLNRWASVNRARGLELTLNLLGRNSRIGRSDLVRQMEDAGWESLLMAWRIVTPSVFRAIYHRRFPRGNAQRSKYASITRLGVIWFVPQKVLGIYEGVQWEADSLLRSLVTSLHLITYLSVAPVLFAMYQMGLRADALLFWIACGVAAVGLVGFVTYHVVRAVRYQKILEKELMAVPSCATLWVVATLAHLSAYRRTIPSRESDVLPYRTYMEYIAYETVSILKSLDNVDQWIKEKMQALAGSEEWTWDA